MSQSNNSTKKPALLRTIFILNALLTLIGFTFYFVISYRVNAGADTLGIPPSTLLTMALIYTAVFGAAVFAILRKNIWLLRGVLMITVITSIVIIFAPIGIVLAGTSIGLSFSKQVTNYFA